MADEEEWDNSWMRSLYEPDMILPGLFLGPVSCSENSSLQSIGITHVLRVIIGEAPDTASHINLWRIDVDDDPDTDLLTYFDDTHQWIAKAISGGGKVLVHCYAGVSRSASIVIAYVMKELGLDFKTAMTLVQRARKVVSPNSGFEKQLQFYGALGCATNGKSPAHASLAAVMAANGRLNTTAFEEQWEDLRAHL